MLAGVVVLDQYGGIPVIYLRLVKRKVSLLYFVIGEMFIGLSIVVFTRFRLVTEFLHGFVR